MSLSPTDPGPFQKYLFSGACYIQVGQCYAALLALPLARYDRSVLESLRDNLTAVWQEGFNRQVAAAGTLPGGPWSMLDGELGEEMGALTAEVRAAGTEAMTRLLDEFVDDTGVLPDFPGFFDAWARACDGAYARVVRSDPFADLLGRMVNGCIDWVAAGSEA